MIFFKQTENKSGKDALNFMNFFIFYIDRNKSVNYKLTICESGKY